MRLTKWTRATLKSAWHRTAAVNLIVTRRCDLACSYCHAVRKGPELAPADWLRIANKLSKRFSVFTISGGEPLLYKGLPDLINGIARIGIAGLCTNARIIKEHHLQAMPGLDYLNFSIDHTGDCSVSKKDAFGKLPLLTEYARRHSFELFGTAVITSRNIDVIPDVAREMARHGIALNLQLVQNPGALDAFDTPAKLVQLARLQTELLAMKRGGVLIDESDAYIKGMTAYVEGSCAVTCHAGDAYLAVDTDGRLMPCQASAAVGASLLGMGDIDAAVRALPQSIGSDCRCWWNCYHRYQAWKKSPLAFLVQSGLKKPLRAISHIMSAEK